MCALTLHDEYPIMTSLPLFSNRTGLWQPLPQPWTQAIALSKGSMTDDVCIMDAGPQDMDADSAMLAIYTMLAEIRLVVNTGSVNCSLADGPEKAGSSVKPLRKKPPTDMSLVADATSSCPIT